MKARNPSVAYEHHLWSAGSRFVAGVDEVGRGALAGPVIAAACVVPAGCTPLEGVRDSKMLTPDQRRGLVSLIQHQAVAVAVGAASRREIDHLNIRVASALAMQRALSRLERWDHALYDGSPAPGMDPATCTPVIDGDALCYSIACASVIAKVARDELLARLARRYPAYGWERNAGYGTREHLEALARLGPTAHHRRSFRPVRDAADASGPRRQSGVLAS